MTYFSVILARRITRRKDDLRKIQYAAALGLCALTIMTGKGMGVIRSHAAVIIPVETDADADAEQPAEETEEEEAEPESLGFFILDEAVDEAAGEAAEAAAKSAGQQVAEFAVQFVGNPYRYGGTSLTNGADCSGFVMSVYRNFGISLPHSSSALTAVGRNIGTNLANAVPGDLICYSGHVGIYIGNGKIVHSSTASTGIKISNAAYRSIRSIRRVI